MNSLVHLIFNVVTVNAINSFQGHDSISGPHYFGVLVGHQSVIPVDHL